MEKIKGFQISSMTVSGFKCYEAPMEITVAANPVWRTRSHLPSQGFPFSGSAALTGCTTRRTRTCRSRCALRMKPEKHMN